MGDTGSLTLGYSIAFLAISFSMNNKDITPFFEGAIVTAFTTLLVPVLDVARVIWVRFRNGRSIFEADRNHIHHRFLALGFSHRVTMVNIILIALFFCIFNTLSVQYISNNIVLMLDLFFWLALDFFLTRAEKSQKAFSASSSRTCEQIAPKMSLKKESQIAPSEA